MGDIFRSKPGAFIIMIYLGEDVVVFKVVVAVEMVVVSVDELLVVVVEDVVGVFFSTILSDWEEFSKYIS